MTRHSVAIAFVAAFGVVLAGCATAPLSFINDQQVFHRQVLNRFPVRLLAIDGSYTAFRPVPIAPGTHTLLLAASPVAGFRVPPEKTYPMTIAPCTRYYIAAQRISPLLQDWELVVEETYPVAGCNPAQELEKAKTAAISGLVPQASSTVEASPPIAQNAPR
ncbi:MAG: hypothetical protein ACR2GP_07675 [Burkholderiaceae bacterium]